MAGTGRQRDGRSTPDQARKLKAIAITGGQPLAAPPEIRSSHWMLGTTLHPTSGHRPHRCRRPPDDRQPGPLRGTCSRQLPIFSAISIAA
jgi:hypothetical protein